jgi:flagellar hook-basal body complex protein FliE
MMADDFMITGPGDWDFPRWETEQAGGARPGAPEFLRTLREKVGEVNRRQVEAEQAVAGFYAGEVQDIHTVALAMKKADLAFRYLLAVRNEAMKAYQEISRLS